MFFLLKVINVDSKHFICLGVSLATPFVDSYNSTNDTCRYGLLLGSTFKGIGDICAPGYYCKSGSSQPIPCPAGSYNIKAGQERCEICPSGYYCQEGTISYNNMTCPSGYYCERNTTHQDQYPCSPGTFNNMTGQKDISSCLPCLQGHYCAGYGNPQTTALCAAGWFCNGSSISNKPSINGGKCMPGFYCPGGSSAPKKCDLGKFCSISELEGPNGNCSAGYYCNHGSTMPIPNDGIQGNRCPLGKYCPEGTVAPISCDPGTFLDRLEAKNISDCIPCTSGKFCNASGLPGPVGDCFPGYYCPSGQSSPISFICDEGYFCTGGRGFQEKCPTGMYQNKKGQISCKKCEERYFCNATYGPVVNYTRNICPQGYYCPQETEFAEQYPCDIGTFNNITGRANQSECTPCLGGFYCGRPGLVYPETPCQAGYYCKSGAKTATPEEGDNANICTHGHYCPIQTATPEKCPEGYLGLSLGLISEDQCTKCPAGKYCNILGNFNTTILCSEGFYCPNGSISATQVECPAGAYCPAGSSMPLLCPVGKFSSKKRLNHESQCTNCTAGSYCDITGLVKPTGPCKEGYYCPEGSKVKNSKDCLIGLHCPNGK